MKGLRFDKIKSILFIHHMLAMGEVVLLTGIYEAIKKQLSDVQMSIIARNYACQFLKVLPYFQQIIPIEKLGLYRNKSKLYTGIKIFHFFLSHKYDWIVWREDRNLPYNLFFKLGISINRPKRKINFAPLLKKYCNSNLHICEIYARVLKKVGFSVGPYVKPYLAVNTEDVLWAKNFLGKKGIKKEDKIVGICPVSNLKIKNWTTHKVNLLIEYITQNKGVKVLLFAQNFPVDKKVVEIGRLPFNRLMALIKLCNVFVSVDTGPMHTASALGIPTIALFGPTSGKMFAPLSKGSKVIQKEISCPYYNPYASLFPYSNEVSCYQQDRCLWKKKSCINLIEVDEVWKALKEFI